MRKTILATVLAVTLLPGLAQAQMGNYRDDRHGFRPDHRDGGDWRDYRRRNPDLYRGQRWVGPRGYAYRPVDVGYRFRPDFYDRRYWVDPYRFHLRPISGPLRWIRYGRDVLLVDTRSGRVIEVNRDFFF